MTAMTAYAKAILAGIIALVGSIAVGYTDETLTKAEFWAALSTGLVALGGVFGVRNSDDDTDEFGAAGDQLLWFIVGALSAVLALLLAGRLG